MANKRMFSADVVEREDFLLELPISSQALYFHLNMYSDDEGFVHSPKLIMRNCGATTDDFNALVKSGYVIAFDSGICLIRHWFLSNYKSRANVNPTIRTQEKALVELVDDKVYELKSNIMSNNLKNRLVEFSVDESTGEMIDTGESISGKSISVDFSDKVIGEERVWGNPSPTDFGNLTEKERNARKELFAELKQMDEKRKPNNFPQ